MRHAALGGPEGIEPGIGGTALQLSGDGRPRQRDIWFVD